VKPRDERGDEPAAAANEARSQDRAVVVGEVGGGDQRTFAVLRRRSADAPVEAGLLRSLREGQPIVGEVVKLTQSDAASPVLDVDVQVPGPLRRAHDGPVHVTSRAYRDGWDAIFGDRTIDRSKLS
jgi:hypothetical protein